MGEIKCPIIEVCTTRTLNAYENKTPPKTPNNKHLNCVDSTNKRCLRDSTSERCLRDLADSPPWECPMASTHKSADVSGASSVSEHVEPSLIPTKKPNTPSSRPSKPSKPSSKQSISDLSWASSVSEQEANHSIQQAKQAQQAQQANQLSDPAS